MKNFKYLSLLAGTTMLLGANFAFAATNDYTNYWMFDEGTGKSIGDSAGGKNGVLVGSSTGLGWASGQAGTALGMDGLSGESVVLPDGLLSGSQGSVVLWLKVNSYSDRNVIFSARSTTDNYVYAALTVDLEGRPQFQHRATRDGSDQKAQGAKSLNKNEWYQLVFTSNAQTYRMFVNGEELIVAGNNAGRWFPELTNNTLMYRIGSIESNVLNGSFDGYLDDLRIYNRALTPDEVTALYNGGTAGKPGIPVAARVVPPPAVPVVEVALGTPTPVAPQVIAVPAQGKAVLVLTRNLYVGLRGDDVRDFQNVLIGKGYLGAEFATGYFGALTKAAAIKLQKELALPQTGFIGPMTRGKLSETH